MMGERITEERIAAIEARAVREAPADAAADVASWRVDPRCELHPLDREWRFYLAPLVAQSEGM